MGNVQHNNSGITKQPLSG